MRVRRSAAAVAALLILATASPPTARAAAPRVGLEAYFELRSSLPSRSARLIVLSHGQEVTVQLFRAGPERGPTHTDRMRGMAVAEARTLRGGRHERRSVGLWLSRRYQSGLYFARLHDRHGRVTFAPLVLRRPPARHSRIAVVLPTNTWQAYNYHDDNGDGIPDSWYADARIHSVVLNRPYAHRGAPPHYRQYDLGFIRWLAQTHRRPDFLADDDLETIASAAQLRRRYDLIVFSGHEEYVTAHAYDLIEGYRDGGGNLMFLSANNFFNRVTRAGGRITKIGRWRDVGRPEARWIGIQYLDWNHNVFHNAPYVVTGARSARWLFRGTGLSDGERFGSYGIEIDARTGDSPSGTRVLARAPNIFGPGQSAEMTYHETAAGAKVFAAGVINFGGSALSRPVPAMLENLWGRLGRP